VFKEVNKKLPACYPEHHNAQRYRRTDVIMMPTADRTVPIVVRSAKNQRLRIYSFYGWDLVDRRYLWWVWAPRFYRWATSVRLERYELFVLFDHYEPSRAGKAWGYVIRIVRSLRYLRHSALFNYSVTVSVVYLLSWVNYWYQTYSVSKQVSK